MTFPWLLKNNMIEKSPNIQYSLYHRSIFDIQCKRWGLSRVQLLAAMHLKQIKAPAKFKSYESWQAIYLHWPVFALMWLCNSARRRHYTQLICLWNNWLHSQQHLSDMVQWHKDFWWQHFHSKPKFGLKTQVDNCCLQQKWNREEKRINILLE